MLQALPAAALSDPGAGALAGWAPDEAFLARATRRAADADLVSLDVFDTALTRLVDSPADLFAEVERVLGTRIGAASSGFAQAREDAERRARLLAHERDGAEEIGLDAVLDALCALLPTLAPHRALLREVELDTEARLLVPVPDILALTRRLLQAGRPFAFVSDMYLPPFFIAERLRAGGYAGWDALHVSTETGATKASGRQWAAVRARHPDRPRILHIGDDPQADGEIPRRHGVDTLLYDRARSARRVGAALRPALLPFSFAQRDAALRARAVPGAAAGPDAFWFGLGRVLGGIVLAGFVRWLEAELRRHRIARVCFCARDGWLIRQAWHAAGGPARTGIPDDYLAVSRRPLNLARGYLASTPERLDQALLGFLAGSDGTTTVAAALARAGLDGDASLVSEMRDRFGGLDARLVWPDGTGRFEQGLARHPAAVHAALRPEHAALTGYLRQQALGAGRIGLVDLGWHGNLQRALRTVVEADIGPVRLHGFYYGLWPATLGNRYGAGPMDAAFASDFQPVEDGAALRGAVAILEELHGAPHGTVLGYREEAGRWTPVFADNPSERAQHERTARPFQQGALQTVSALFGTGRAGTLRLHDVTPDAVRAALGAVCSSPDPHERAALGGLGHCATFDHASAQPLVPDGPAPDDPEALRVALRDCGWPVGTAHRWLAQAAPDRRQALAASVQEQLSALGPRALRQFE